MNTQAIIDFAGHQFFVKEGDIVSIDKHLETPVGKTLTIDQVLLVTAGDQTHIGAPLVEGASVILEVKEQGKGEKIHVSRFRNKSRFRRKIGHRQPQTKLLVTKITTK